MSSIGNYEKGATKTDITRVGQTSNANPYLDLSYKLAEEADKSNALKNLMLGGPGYLGSFSGTQKTTSPPPAPGGGGGGIGGPEGPLGPYRRGPQMYSTTPSRSSGIPSEGSTSGTAEARINPFTGLPVGQWGAQSLYGESSHLGGPEEGVGGEWLPTGAGFAAQGTPGGVGGGGSGAPGGAGSPGGGGGGEGPGGGGQDQSPGSGQYPGRRPAPLV